MIDIYLVDDFVGGKGRSVHLVRKRENRQLPHAANLVTKM